MSERFSVNKKAGFQFRKIFAFCIWSVLVLAMGLTSSPYLGFLKAHAEVEPKSQPSIVRLDRARLEGKNLGLFEPYEPSRSDLIARGYDYFYSHDENLGIGVWESKPGEMAYSDLKYDEMMLVLEGHLIMTSRGGEPEVFRAGEGLVLPRGWSGLLTVPEGGVRKIWVSYMGSKKGY